MRPHFDTYSKCYLVDLLDRLEAFAEVLPPTNKNRAWTKEDKESLTRLHFLKPKLSAKEIASRLYRTVNAVNVKISLYGLAQGRWHLEGAPLPKNKRQSYMVDNPYGKVRRAKRGGSTFIPSDFDHIAIGDTRRSGSRR